MRGIQKIALCVLAALIFWSCEKPQTEEPKEDQKADFVLAVSDVTAVSCGW